MRSPSIETQTRGSTPNRRAEASNIHCQRGRIQSSRRGGRNASRVEGDQRLDEVGRVAHDGDGGTTATAGGRLERRPYRPFRAARRRRHLSRHVAREALTEQADGGRVEDEAATRHAEPRLESRREFDRTQRVEAHLEEPAVERHVVHVAEAEDLGDLLAYLPRDVCGRGWAGSRLRRRLRRGRRGFGEAPVCRFAMIGLARRDWYAAENRGHSMSATIACGSPEAISASRIGSASAGSMR